MNKENPYFCSRKNNLYKLKKQKIMTRSEFDQQIRELKNKRNAAIREVAALQSEIKEEIASKKRMIQEIGKEVQKLKQSLQGYYQRRIALDAEWNAKINAFIKENEQSTTSNLAEASSFNVVQGFD